MPPERRTDRAAFATLVAGCGVDPATASSLHAELVARHREPHRRYHTLDHVEAVLGHLDRTAADLPDRRAVELAAWYHDVIHDPRGPGDDEDASARLATDRLRAAGVAGPLVDDVARLVRATAAHRPGRADEAALCDADLAVLGAGPEGYERYRATVREEWGHLDDDTWRLGRAAVLRGLLATEPLFATATMAERERAARANLAAELASLEGDDH